MESLTSAEKKLFTSLNSPKKIQDFINTLPMRKQPGAPLLRSPRTVLKERTANCIEGALLAAAIFMHHGEKPLLLDLKVNPKNKKDMDHVVALFKRNGHFGAISQTSHAVLRYREPIYKTIRELTLSYFHEYFTDDGKKNLRSFSKPFDVRKKFGTKWVTAENNLFDIATALDHSPHTNILTKEMERDLRLADAVEIAAGKIQL